MSRVLSALACEDANYAIQSLDLYDRPGGIAYLSRTKHKLVPENVVIQGDSSALEATWDSLPYCFAGSSSHELDKFTIMASSQQTSCGSTAPGAGDFTPFVPNIARHLKYRAFAPKSPSGSYWYAMRAEWDSGSSAMSDPVCITGAGSARMLPEPKIPLEAGWHLAGLLPQDEPVRVEPYQAAEGAPQEFLSSPYRSIGEGGSTNPAVSLSFYHLDHLGTPRVITDVLGQPISKHKYLPFGEEMNPPPFPPHQENRAFTRDCVF